MKKEFKSFKKKIILNNNMKVNLPKNIIFEHIKEEGFLFNEETEKIFEVNGTGVFIINLILKGVEDKREIINEITNEYEVEKEVASQGFDEFIKKLKELNLILINNDLY
jgi:hypothetical protein